MVRVIAVSSLVPPPVTAERVRVGRADMTAVLEQLFAADNGRYPDMVLRALSSPDCFGGMDCRYESWRMGSSGWASDYRYIFEFTVPDGVVFGVDGLWVDPRDSVRWTLVRLIQGMATITEIPIDQLYIPAKLVQVTDGKQTTDEWEFCPNGYLEMPNIFRQNTPIRVELLGPEFRGGQKAGDRPIFEFGLRGLVAERPGRRLAA